jgi:hypothetical protein
VLVSGRILAQSHTTATHRLLLLYSLRLRRGRHSRGCRRGRGCRRRGLRRLCGAGGFPVGATSNERVPVSPGTRREAPLVGRVQRGRTHFFTGFTGALTVGGGAGVAEKSKACRHLSFPSPTPLTTWAAALAAISWSTMRSPLPSRRWELATGWSIDCDGDYCRVAQS